MSCDILRLADATVSGRRVTLARGGSAVFFPVPAGRSAGGLAHRAVPLTGSIQIVVQEITAGRRRQMAALRAAAEGAIPAADGPSLEET